MTDSNNNQSISSFSVQDCVLAPIATGIKAQNAREFTEKLATVPAGCLFYHFWSGRLRSTVYYWEFHNDFSYWTHHCLHDNILTERLEILDPVMHKDIEELRAVIIDIFENRMDELENIPWAKKEDQFHFIYSKIVVFNTRFVMHDPKDLLDILPLMSKSSIFYHFIDGRRRTPENEDDFSRWLKSFSGKYDDLIFQLKKIDPFFISLSDLQTKLISVINNYFHTYQVY